MRAPTVITIKVASQDSSQITIIQNPHVVQAILPYTAAVKCWYESDRQKINRLRKELAELETRVEQFDKVAKEDKDYER